MDEIWRIRDKNMEQNVNMATLKGKNKEEQHMM